ncbi:hypothetical protein SLA_2398 [Streptomyces laurentii]|uniref:Uncharacterized protein n=1 Tax=Streptomyces laurentii TaxID=39478 RepID=A0A160NYT9_STRLU|nr:hypothetical protein SLA_2398 [Streptomyces laurentii]
MTTCGHCDTALADRCLCPGCTRDLATRLRRMPLLYRALAGFLAPSTARAPGGSRTSRAEAPLPVCERVLDLRGPGGIVGILEDWVTAMYRDRGQTASRVQGSVEQRVTRAASTLARNCPALAAEWPAIGDLARELQALERDIASITGIVGRPRGQRLGPCPAQYDDGTLCGATLRLQPDTTVVTCRWCGTTYPPATWTDLRTLIEQTAA